MIRKTSAPTSAKEIAKIKPVRKLPAKTRAKIAEAAEMKLRLEAELLQLLDNEAALETELSTAFRPLLVKKVVHHKQFGDGVVASQTDGIIDVEFSDGMKAFQYPLAIVSKFLSIDDASVAAQLEEMADKQAALKLLHSEVDSKKRELDGMKTVL
jgi:hypothetical protein